MEHLAYAHNDLEKSDFDGYGKMPGLCAAIFALSAAIVAFAGCSA